MGVKILVGDCRERLKELDDGSVHVCITSPPYWSLRDYGTDPLVWGGQEGCEHEWGNETRRRYSGGTTYAITGQHKDDHTHFDASQGQFCRHCSAWRGSLGLEPTPALYVEHLVEVMREVKRVLRDDGTVWLNLGDSYASSPKGNLGALSNGLTNQGRNAQQANQHRTQSTIVGNLKSKDLVGIPWRVAFALQDDGWYLRSSTIWAKGISFASHKTKCPHCNHKYETRYSGSCMPGSQRDRPTTSYENVFLLTKNKRYFYDNEAVKEPSVSVPHPDVSSYPPGSASSMRNGKHQKKRIGGVPFDPGSGRTLRSVWAINPRGYKEAHFATFPTTLVTPMMMAGTSERGACPDCGAPWERVIQKPDMSKRPTRGEDSKTETTDEIHISNNWAGTPKSAGQEYQKWRNANPDITLGWRPGCGCYQASPWPFKRKKIKPDMLDTALSLLEEYSTLPTVPCVALDPFGGAGTVGVVATQLGRDAILCELNEEYCEMSRRRIEKVEPIEHKVKTVSGSVEAVAVEQSTMFPVEVL